MGVTQDAETEATFLHRSVEVEMDEYGIKRVPVDYFYYREFRYTNVKDAIAMAKRDKGKE